MSRFVFFQLTGKIDACKWIRRRVLDAFSHVRYDTGLYEVVEHVWRVDEFRQHSTASHLGEYVVACTCVCVCVRARVEIGDGLCEMIYARVCMYKRMLIFVIPL